MHIDPCECGAEMVERSTDGLCEIFHCADCGELLADLPFGAEP